MRIDKYLSKTIIGSRKKAKEFIKKKLIYINDSPITSDSYQVDENSEIYFINNSEKEKLIYEEYIYIMLNKPQNYVSATHDNLHRSVMELISEYKERDLHIVGRLDIDTEGLLLITDDGSFTHKVTSPKSNIIKKYYVDFDGILSTNACEKVEQGILLDDGEITKPGKLEILSNSSAYITISEGKFHQVKRMFADLNTKVTYLKRVQIGNLALDVESGKYRKLSKDEINKVI